MKQEDRQLLLKDLSARLPYHPMVHIHDLDTIDYDNYLYATYLRPMSSMTEEEDKEWRYYKNAIAESCDERLEERINELHDWFNANHFDYRGLIPKGLAIEVTKENNPYEKINL